MVLSLILVVLITAFGVSPEIASVIGIIFVYLTAAALGSISGSPSANRFGANPVAARAR
jgi:hypothetical protein